MPYRSPFHSVCILACRAIIANTSFISGFGKKLGYRRGLCPNAEKLYEEIISLPLYYAMSDEDVESVIEAVRKIAAFYRV